MILFSYYHKVTITITQQSLNKSLHIKGVTFKLLFTYGTIPVYYRLVARPYIRDRIDISLPISKVVANMLVPAIVFSEG